MHLNAWQLILWILGLEIVSAPIVVAVVKAIMDGYFHCKEMHFGRVAGVVGKILESNGKELKKVVKDISNLKAKENSENSGGQP